MATVAASIEYLGSMVIVTWNPLTQANADGGWIDLRTFGPWDMWLQLFGTYGGATVVLQGTLESATPNNPVTLLDAAQMALSFTAGTVLKKVLDRAYQIRPLLTGGDGTTSLTVKVMVQRQTRG